MTGPAGLEADRSVPAAAGSNTDLVAGLAAQASALIDRLPGPLRRVRVQLGDAAVEVEWASQGPVADSVKDAEGTENGPISTGFVVEAPVVGVFYRSPSPEEPPFVELGEQVEVGQQLGIVEAMKLMNPIQAEVAGVLAAVHIETAQGVEFGQPLFEILPNPA